MAEIGFDMSGTIKWYKKHEKEIFAKLPQSTDNFISHEIVSPEKIVLSKGELSALYNLFPATAIERMIPGKIIGHEPLWFDKKSKNGKPSVTTDINLAKSPTAIVPSYIDYALWQETGTPSADIWLYKIISDIPENVKKIIISEGFIHELAHSMTAEMSYSKVYHLKSFDGNTYDGEKLFLDFAKIAENYPPISHYASAYRGLNNKFEGDENYNALIAIQEEIAETITAYLLGFSFSDNEKRGLDPFSDRPEVKKFIDFLLHSYRI